MHRPLPGASPGPRAQRARRPWQIPAVTDLPRLTALTLATGPGIPGGGGPGGGGSTVIP
jgi:hypothetical protein